MARKNRNWESIVAVPATRGRVASDYDLERTPTDPNNPHELTHPNGTRAESWCRATVPVSDGSPVSEARTTVGSFSCGKDRIGW